jgi:hypothetical protein
VELHFDLYNHVQTKKKAKAVFAPFSHDATGTPGDDDEDDDDEGEGDGSGAVPEPASLVAWSLFGGLGLMGARRRRTG